MLKRALGVGYAEYAIVGFLAVVLGVSSLLTLGGNIEQRGDKLHSQLDAAQVAKLEEKYRQQSLHAEIPVIAPRTLPDTMTHKTHTDTAQTGAMDQLPNHMTYQPLEKG